MNPWLIDVLNPSFGRGKCPEDGVLIVSETGDAGVKYLTGSKEGWYLNNKPMPAEDADTWNCKALVMATKEPKYWEGPETGWNWDGASEERGYLYIIPEQFGFGDWVKVIVQPPTGYLDYNFRSETEDPTKMTKVFRSVRTNRFIIPDEYDVLIEFEPKSGDPGYNKRQQAAIEQGNFRLKAQHITQAEATRLSTSTEKPFAGVESLTEVEKNTELKDLIVYVERLPVKDSYAPVTIDTTDYGDFFKPIANQDSLPKSPEAVSGDMGRAPLLKIGAEYMTLGVATALYFASMM